VPEGLKPIPVPLVQTMSPVEHLTGTSLTANHSLTLANCQQDSSAKHVHSDTEDCGQQQSRLSALCHSVSEKLVITKYHLFLTTCLSVFKSVILDIFQ